jgi:GMP synthase (glutamine-hydrolysing)
MKKLLIINFGSSKTPQIEEMVYEFSDYLTLPFDEINDATATAFDGVILTGSPILITEQEITPFLERLQWIKSTEKPVLGICFGHQILGLLYNAHPARMKECRSMNEIEQFAECPILNRLPQVFEMQEDHCESISIPEEFELVANSDECINEVMQHEKKSLYGVQFHPEVSGNHGAIIFENFIQLC